jgi:hypothetical protein
MVRKIYIYIYIYIDIYIDMMWLKVAGYGAYHRCRAHGVVQTFWLNNRVGC